LAQAVQPEWLCAEERVERTGTWAIKGALL
jgi:hypothetical protein